MKLKFFLLICSTIFILPLHAQNEGMDSLYQQKEPIRKKKNFFQTIGHLISDMDTTYISPNKYNLAFMLENSEWYEYYRFKSSEGGKQSLRISPDMSYKLGAYFGWRWIFLGWSIDMKDLFGKNKSSGKETEFALSLYSSVAGIDIYSKKSHGDFKIKDATGFFNDGTIPDYPKDFEGFSVDIKGLNVYWIFNHKRFSYPAAYSQSTNQRRSAGSIITGFSVSKHNLHFDYDKLPSVILENLDNSLKFREVSYLDISLNVGYAYNWVFAKNCLANFSLSPAIAYKKSKINGEEVYYAPLKNINFDLITRVGVTYNNSKYFVGASLLMHTYDYQSDKFNLNNSFGTLRVYVGFNFWKKKKL